MVAVLVEFPREMLGSLYKLAKCMWFVMVEIIVVFTFSWPSANPSILATFLATIFVESLTAALALAFASPSLEIALDPIVIVVVVLFDMIG